MVRKLRLQDVKGPAEMSISSEAPERWFHPLISRAEQRLNRRRFVSISGSALAVAAAMGPALSGAGAQTSTPIDDQLTGDDDAVTLLRESAEAMAALETFMFEIETVRGQSTIFQGLSVDLIEGGVRRPHDFTATVTVTVPFGTLDVTAIGLDGSAWVQDPLADGEWIALEGSESIVALINPDTLILASVGLIQDARIGGTEQIDGVETTVVAGAVSFADTAERLGGGEMALPAEVSTEPLPVLIWIDGEGRMLEIEVLGPILTSESDDVIRTIRFFEFNEPIEIERPDV
jgi:hypothetical protein